MKKHTCEHKSSVLQNCIDVTRTVLGFIGGAVLFVLMFALQLAISVVPIVIAILIVAWILRLI